MAYKEVIEGLNNEFVQWALINNDGDSAMACELWRIPPAGLL